VHLLINGIDPSEVLLLVEKADLAVEFGLAGKVGCWGGGKESCGEAHETVGVEEKVGGGEETGEGGGREREVGARRGEVG
jgi:hypothetical protein